ncbi:MAG: hypothetical protein IJB86_02630 [Clostridia bacterium]|nr:hypothetical protein [Clostridia bacterium]
MKHDMISSKKLIKNFVYLIVSALVLVSATVAWFATGDESTVETISIPLATSQFDIKYYRADVSGKEFVYDEAAGKVVSASLAEKQALSWVATDNIDIDTLYPGVYNAFKIVVSANEAGNPSLLFDAISCLYPADTKIAYDSIFISAEAYDVNGIQTASASGCFSDFIPEGSNAMTVFGLGSVAQNAMLTIYVDIGIPGYDVNETHNELQNTGAELRIGSVAVS